MRARRHEIQHRDGEHRIGARGEEGDAPRLVLFLVARGDDDQDLLLVGTDQPPKVYQYECPEPGTDTDRVLGRVTEEIILTEIAPYQGRAVVPGTDSSTTCDNAV